MESLQPAGSFEQEAKHGQKKKRTVLGIAIKKQTTLKNVFALPLIFAINSASGAYYNTQ